MTIKKFRTNGSTNKAKNLRNEDKHSYADLMLLNVPILDGEEWSLSEAIDRFRIKSESQKDELT